MLKYVVIDQIKPVIFSPMLKHSEMDSLGKITSAGFFSIETQSGELQVTTSGQSTSLGMRPAETDRALLQLYLEMAQVTPISGRE